LVLRWEWSNPNYLDRGVNAEWDLVTSVDGTITNIPEASRITVPADPFITLQVIHSTNQKRLYAKRTA
jgi:hypothetical protein